ETELWPNLFAACERRGIRLVLANARLSERSARGYRWVRPLIAHTLDRLSLIAAQTEADARRLVALGADPEHVQVTGSIKFDLQLPASLREQAAVLRRRLGISRSVLIAASTHDGEEAQVLDAFERIRAEVPDCLLLLVPRHPERFGLALSQCRRRGLACTSRSANPRDCDGMDVFVGDSMGELPLYYAAADVAFVGGSLVPVGGHNMLEPSALGLPVVFGPHVFNFSEISQQLCECGAARQVADMQGLAVTAITLLKDANLRHQMGDRGREFVGRNRGALKRVLQEVDKALRSANPPSQT
ncbi:MAG: 3-deoxy-D-manno-octulosonic acid transferase, partial [Gammaproteobacteria bacterium]|nr:3-deoxy-D-manno-octulosonic acid transferase [Gammaproteobacteria bacterium]